MSIIETAQKLADAGWDAQYSEERDTLASRGDILSMLDELLGRGYSFEEYRRDYPNECTAKVVFFFASSVLENEPQA